MGVRYVALEGVEFYIVVTSALLGITGNRCQEQQFGQMTELYINSVLSPNQHASEGMKQREMGGVSTSPYF